MCRKKLSGTMEALLHHAVTGRVSDGIRYAPKTEATWGQGIGGGHSTGDGEDNKTSSEGRTSASAKRIDVRGTA
jgi:hypothetical protein